MQTKKMTALPFCVMCVNWMRFTDSNTQISIEFYLLGRAVAEHVVLRKFIG